MMDILAGHGHLFLGSRLKRLADRMLTDASAVLAAAKLPMQPSQQTLLAALDDRGPLTVGGLVDAIGISQPAVTRSLGALVELGLVETGAVDGDARVKQVRLTEAGRSAVARARAEVWPAVEQAARELCAGLPNDLLADLGMLERALQRRPLAARVRDAAAGLRLVEWRDELAGLFHDINAEWIGRMFVLEDVDREVLENPREHILAPGGAVLFVEADGLGIVGACALKVDGAGAAELTKMGVLERARGRKAGEFLLAHAIERGRGLGLDSLYLLTNRRCQAAIHLYEKAGFRHDPGVMAAHGGDYARCDVAMALDL